MLSIPYFLLFLLGGAAIVRWQLPRLKAPVRLYAGLGLGWLSLQWLPALWACAVSFTVTGHLLALATFALLTLAAYLLRSREPVRPMEKKDIRPLTGLFAAVLLLTVLGGYLEYTHTIRLAQDGTYHVGQSTYGDLQLHLAITTSAVNAKFPLHNSLLLGATMAYPYLSDTVASTMVLMGMPLAASMVITGTIMLFLVFWGYALLAWQLCRRKGAALLALLLLFLNGGLGILYTMDATVDGSVTTWLDNLKTAMTGYYATPTNQPTPHNLRWVNLICDMLIPQRGILGGWALLMPALNLLLPPLCRTEENKKTPLRQWLLLGVFAGALPLVHTHSYLALVLLSAGICGYCFLHASKGEKGKILVPWLWYAGVAALLSVPQLVLFTFKQTSSSNHFLQLWFNWVNNRNGEFLGAELIDGYFWFYLKNIGVPYLLILMALLRRAPKGLSAADPEVLSTVRQNRMIACGAFLIYAAAECIQFQPNIYDNNKLFYVWFLLCLPMAADLAVSLWKRLRGMPGRRVLAAAFVFLCFGSSLVTVARECVSDYQAYDTRDIAAAEFIKENTPEHCVFLTGTQHLNPVTALAGRTIVCGPDLYLYFHGFSTSERQAEVAQFYSDPAGNLAFLKKYGVEYIYISPWERNDQDIDEEALETLFEEVYSSEDGQTRIFLVPEEYR